MTLPDLNGFEDKNLVDVIRHAQGILPARIADRKNADEALSRDAFLPENNTKLKRAKRATKAAR